MQHRIAQLRERARAGTLTSDEMKEAIVFLRGERSAAVSSSRIPASRVAKATVDTDALLGELGL